MDEKAGVVLTCMVPARPLRLLGGKPAAPTAAPLLPPLMAALLLAVASGMPLLAATMADDTRPGALAVPLLPGAALQLLILPLLPLLAGAVLALLDRQPAAEAAIL